MASGLPQSSDRPISTPDDWTRSDKYHNSFLIPDDATLDAVVKHSAEEGLDDIAVSRSQGKFLYLVAKSINAKNYLEVGTLGGYSGIWVSRALAPGGKAITLELEENTARIARENFKTAGVENIITVVIGPALDSFKTLQPEEPFDLVFIDADKENNLNYFNAAKKLTRKGGVIIIDNVVRYAKVADPALSDASIEGVRNLLKGLKEDPDIEATTVATVGEKGYDGFIYAILK